jgi:two-component system sensor histidine kinase RegB
MTSRSASGINHFELGRRARQLRVDTLARLRWLAVAGQTAAVLTAYFLFGFPLPLEFCLMAIALSVWLNIGLRIRYPVSHRLEDGSAFLLLTFDVLQLSGLLYLTGGLTNPFAILFLAPIMASAVSLPPRWTLQLMLVMIAAASLLAFHHFDLPWRPGEPLSLPIVYVAGIWTSIVLGAGFIAVYASRVAEEARQLSDALAATELVLAREQHLTQLDGLAAAAAHELGTPLATITLAIKDLVGITPDGTPHAEDVHLIAQEVQRCRAILKKLTSLGRDGDGLLDTLTLGHLIGEVIEPHRGFGAPVAVRSNGTGPEPVCPRNPGILYGLGNLLENAIDFAASKVRLEASWTLTDVSIEIADDGPGFAPEILNRLGEPYVTTRPGIRAATDDGFGLGLGVFIAKTLLERSSATVTTKNAVLPETGARVVITWPRSVFERKPDSIAWEEEIRRG